ncbi:hypothetical protein [Curtobacterium sp. MCSS17_016]|uniref:hypothetical protein n=1 Tax=Curtobacterium sp. MCSS17_016 TaxID=2175644 RepID=UPI000DA848FA|nr:hypothetical protein [Curtobacterium sp. MCSS17_016]WIE80935.1 hypothetical protein DEJ19_020680 [Curtobacterium sp. MCSS17_016]
MLAFTPTDWFINAAIGAAWGAAIIWVAVEGRRSARRWDTLQAGIRHGFGFRTAQEHAAVAAHHAAGAAVAHERAKAAVAVAEKAYEDVLRIARAARTR